MRKPIIKVSAGLWRVALPDTNGWQGWTWQENRAVHKAVIWCTEANIREGRYRGLLSRT